MRWKSFEDFKNEYKNSKSTKYEDIKWHDIAGTSGKKIIINNIKDLEEFLELGTRFGKKFFYRGQKSSKWKLTSSYSRTKFLRYFLPKENYFTTHKKYEQLVEIWKEKKNYLMSRGIKSEWLEFLSEAQHFGIETILIDFTSEIYNAIWFAIADELNDVELVEDQCFSIFILDFTSNEINYVIDDIEEKDKLYSCPKNINRGISQKSYFVLENQNWDKSDKIIKVNILKSGLVINRIKEILENKSINGMSIFPDLKGIYLDSENESIEIMKEGISNLSFRGEWLNLEVNYSKWLKKRENLIKKSYELEYKIQKKENDSKTSIIFIENQKKEIDMLKKIDQKIKEHPYDPNLKIKKISILNFSKVPYIVFLKIIDKYIKECEALILTADIKTKEKLNKFLALLYCEKAAFITSNSYGYYLIDKTSSVNYCSMKTNHRKEFFEEFKKSRINAFDFFDYALELDPLNRDIFITKCSSYVNAWEWEKGKRDECISRIEELNWK